MALEHESAFLLQEPIRNFWSVERCSKSAEFPSCGLWHNGLRVTIRHTLFDIFRKRMRSNLNPNRPYLFFRVF